MRAGWTASGACTSGSTAPQRGAPRQATGGAATTNTSRFLKTPTRVVTRRRAREHSPPFRSRPDCSLRSDESERFHQQVERLHDRLDGEAELTTLEGWLPL